MSLLKSCIRYESLYVYIEKKNAKYCNLGYQKVKEFVTIVDIFSTIKDQLPTTEGELEQLRPFDKLKLKTQQYICLLCNRIFKDEIIQRRHLIF